MVDMRVLVERGYEDRIEEMKDLFLELHEKCENCIDLTDEEQVMFDLLMWLYHCEEKPTITK